MSPTTISTSNPAPATGAADAPSSTTDSGKTGNATMLSGNLPFNEWTEVFGTERLTGALFDRLTRHVNILEMNGKSYRLAQSRARKPGEIY